MQVLMFLLFFQLVADLLLNLDFEPVVVAAVVDLMLVPVVVLVVEVAVVELLDH